MVHKRFTNTLFAAAAAALAGWKPPAWEDRTGGRYGRKPAGRSNTRSAAAISRKRRSLARRKAARS